MLAVLVPSLEDESVADAVGTEVTASSEEELDGEASVLLVVTLSLEEASVDELLIEDDSGVGVAETVDVESDAETPLLEMVVLSEDEARSVDVEPGDDSVTVALIVEESTAGVAETVDEVSNEAVSVLVSIEDDGAVETSSLEKVALSVGEDSAATDREVIVADAKSVEEESILEEITLSAVDGSVLDGISLAEESVVEALDENGVGAGVADSTDDESIVEETSSVDVELVTMSLTTGVDSDGALDEGDPTSVDEVCV